MDQILGLYLIGRECNNKNKNKDLQTSNLPSLIKPIYSTDNLTRAEDNEQMLANARLKLSYQNPTLMVNKLINIPMNQQPNGGRTYKNSSLKQTFRPKIIEYFENESKEKAMMFVENILDDENLLRQMFETDLPFITGYENRIKRKRNVLEKLRNMTFEEFAKPWWLWGRSECFLRQNSTAEPSFSCVTAPCARTLHPDYTTV